MDKEKLPDSQTALILGILSIVTSCCCWGIIGVFFGFIGLSKANKAIALHNENPDQYDGINNANTAKTTSIIGIVIGILYMMWLIYLLTSGDYELMMEQYQDLI
jgi:multisubunit Na+/H+ antiporter MnhG subunit